MAIRHRINRPLVVLPDGESRHKRLLKNQREHCGPSAVNKIVDGNWHGSYEQENITKASGIRETNAPDKGATH